MPFLLSSNNLTFRRAMNLNGFTTLLLEYNRRDSSANADEGTMDDICITLLLRSLFFLNLTTGGVGLIPFGGYFNMDGL